MVRHRILAILHIDNGDSTGNRAVIKRSPSYTPEVLGDTLVIRGVLSNRIES